MYVVLVAGILLGATTIVGLFGATGASISISQKVISSFPTINAGEGRHG